MTNRKTTKRALLSSLLALLICCTMLIGTTFAWFTDNEVLEDNKITAGTLDLVLGTNTVLKVDSLWEPGYSEPLSINLSNAGSLWLKYELAFANLKTGENVDGTEFTGLPSNIAEVLDVYAGVYAGVDAETGASIITGEYLGTVADLFDAGVLGDSEAVTGTLKPNSAEKKNINLVIKMKEEAGNEYQGDWCTFDLVAKATQWTEEADGNGNNQYDKEATFGVPVANEAELAAALGDGKDVIVTAPITIDAPITVTGDVTIDLNGNTLTATAIDAARPFVLEDDAVLTVNAKDAEVAVGEWGLVKVPNGGKVVINEGTFTGATDNGALVRVSATNEGDVEVTMNNVKYTDNGAKGFVVSTNGHKGTVKLNVNGGTFVANAGFDLADCDTTIRNATITTKGVAFEVGEGTALIDGCTITVDPGVTVGTAPAACVAVSYGGYAKVVNSTLTGTANVEAAYDVYPTGGTIDAANNTVTGTAAIYKIYNNAGTITIDGKVNS